MANDRLRLRDLERCFLGVIPSTIATCSREGIPNIAYLSIAHRIDDEHLALSFQFFNKTRHNVVGNPRAQLMVVDPATMIQYRVDIEYQRTETNGPIFERMRTNLAAVASQQGMSGVFRLQGVDVYRALAIEALAHDLDLAPARQAADHVAALETLGSRLESCEDLESLLETLLAGVSELFGFEHSMLLFADEPSLVDRPRLYAVASHGFAESGIGAEVVIGEGLIGTAARERRPVRTSSVRRDRIMAEAVHTSASAQGQALEARREIALPGLPDVQSQLAVPILARDRLLGVLCVQSPEPGRFAPIDEQALSALTRLLATWILLLGQGGAGEPPANRVYPQRPAGDRVLTIRHHASDDSVFIDDDYLIKGVPGRILLFVLGANERDGRVDFTNRELRLDESMQLGGYRDNLEARLILLRRRLEERSDALRLKKTGRGRFRLELGRPFELQRVK